MEPHYASSPAVYTNPKTVQYLTEAGNSSYIVAYKRLSRPLPSSSTQALLDMQRAIHALAFLMNEYSQPTSKDAMCSIEAFSLHWREICLYLIRNGVLEPQGRSQEWLELQEKIMYAVPGACATVVAAASDKHGGEVWKWGQRVRDDVFTPDIYSSLLDLWLHVLKRSHPSVSECSAPVDGFMLWRSGRGMNSFRV